MQFYNIFLPTRNLVRGNVFTCLFTWRWGQDSTDPFLSPLTGWPYPLPWTKWPYPPPPPQGRVTSPSSPAEDPAGRMTYFPLASAGLEWSASLRRGPWSLYLLMLMRGLSCSLRERPSHHQHLRYWDLGHGVCLFKRKIAERFYQKHTS